VTKPTMSRRQALKAAAGGMALSAAAMGAARAQEAQQADPTAPTEEESAMAGGGEDILPFAPGWRRTVVGEAALVTVLDGIRPGEGPHPTFGEDQSAESVAELMRANLLPPNRFANFFNPVIVEAGDERILVDTGFGPSGLDNGQGLLANRMAGAGFAPEDITIVALTHFHGDHINGLMTAEGQPAFPNARVVAGQAEWDFWTSDAAKSGPAAGNAKAVEAMVVPLRERITFLNDGDEIVSGMTARAAFGHTPGMLAFEVGSGEGRVFMAADTFSHFVVSFQRPDWHVRFDMDKQAAAETRRRLATMLASERIAVMGYHLPFPAIGFVEAVGDAFRYVPASYQFAVEEG
jgi:glyoxylase-like metal-dependent hydrolase (beta-lactamase superfamily II)